MMRRVPLLSAILLSAAALMAAPIPKDKEKLLPPTEEQLKQSRNNLKQIGIAYHSYNDATGNCPNNVTDKDGKPTLSWRVLMLPYLDEEKLYKEFKLDEPWDSKTNKALIEKIPKVFQSIRVKSEKGETFYRGFDGPDAAFETGQRLSIPRSFPDGTSNTLLVVEAGEPCIWTKPDDLPFNAAKPLPKLGGLFDGDFHVLMCDGSVLLGHSSKMNADEFKKIVTRSDGLVMNFDTAFGIEKK